MKKTIPFILFLATILTFFLVPYFIKVNIECKTQYGSCPEEIIKSISIYQSKNLVSAQRGIEKTLKSNALVSNFSMHFKLPGLLEVNVLIKKPLFAVSDRGSGKIGVVGENGKILSIVDDSPLPQIVNDESLEVGSNVSAQDLFALKLIRGVYDMFQVGRGEIRDNSLLVVLPPNYTVTFPLEGDAQVLLGELRLTYAKIESDKTQNTYSEIDLRFKNPVLR